MLGWSKPCSSVCPALLFKSFDPAAAWAFCRAFSLLFSGDSSRFKRFRKFFMLAFLVLEQGVAFLSHKCLVAGSGVFPKHSKTSSSLKGPRNEQFDRRLLESGVFGGGKFPTLDLYSSVFAFKYSSNFAKPSLLEKSVKQSKNFQYSHHKTFCDFANFLEKKRKA